MDKKQFLILISTASALFFIGGFFGANAYLKHAFNNSIEKAFALNDNENINDMIELQQKNIENFNKAFFTPAHNIDHSGFTFFENENTNSGAIKTENLSNAYKITVNLKPFNNDENNVKVKVGKHRIYNSASIYQTFSVPDKLDKKAVKSIKSGNKLIITVPKLQKS